MVEKTVHYKLRKRKKQWIAIGVTVISGVAVTTMANEESVFADETTVAEVQPVVSQESAQPNDLAQADATTTPVTSNSNEVATANSATENVVEASNPIEAAPITENTAETSKPAETISVPENAVETSAVTENTTETNAPVESAVTENTKAANPSTTTSTVTETSTPVLAKSDDTALPATTKEVETTTSNQTSGTAEVDSVNPVADASTTPESSVAPVESTNPATTPAQLKESQTPIAQDETEQAAQSSTAEVLATDTPETAVTPVAETTPGSVTAADFNPTAEIVAPIPTILDPVAVPDQTVTKAETMPAVQSAATSADTTAESPVNDQAKPDVTEVQSTQLTSSTTQAPTQVKAVQPAMAVQAQILEGPTDSVELELLADTTPTTTNNIPASDQFSVSNVDPLQWTYEHKPLTDVAGAGAWQGSDYAAAIPADAKGVDSQKQAYYIDEWMPDYAFQYFLWESVYQSKYATIGDFRNNFTKAELAQLENLASDMQKQAYKAPGQTKYSMNTYYQALMSMYSLEGLQYATNLKTLVLKPNESVSADVFDSSAKNGNLWDISSLANLKQLTQIELPMFSIDNIQALANKPDLVKLNLSYNQISDLSPLQTNRNPNLNLKVGFNHQHVLLKPITLKDGTTTFTTPSFIVKDLTADNLPVKPFDRSEDYGYAAPYPSNSAGGNLDSTTINWTDILNPVDYGQSQYYGTFTVSWVDPNSDYTGWFIQPYQLKQGVGNVTVSYQLLQADGKQLSLAPDSILAGNVRSDFDLNDTSSVAGVLQILLGGKSPAYSFSGLALDGSGKVSDYLANDGLANATGITGAYTDDGQNITLIFYKNWQVDVKYGVIDPNTSTGTNDLPTNTPVTENGVAVGDTILTGNLKNKITLADVEKNFTDLTPNSVWTSNDGKNWTQISDETAIPFIDSNQTVYVLYEKAGYATVTIMDKTTGEKLTTLDAQVDAELKGKAGQPSAFDKATALKDYLAKNYQWDSDDLANGVQYSADPAVPNAYTIYLTHKVADTQQNVDYSVHYEGIDGSTPTTDTQTVVWNVATDLVTGQVTYTPQVGKVTFEVPQVAGYTPNQTLVAFDLTPQTNEPTAKEQTVMYQKNPVVVEKGTILVHFKDAQGQILAPDQVITDEVGTDYHLTSPTIKDYQVTEIKGDTSGKIVAGTTEVTYIYQKTQTDVKSGTVTVYYQTKDGQTIAVPQVIKGTVGDPYQVTAQKIAGYHFVKVTGELKGVIKNQPQIITYWYEADQPTTPVSTIGKVVIHYRDDKGNPIATDQTMTGKVTDSYTVQVPQIKGYHFLKLVGESNGHYGKVPGEVVVMYQKDVNGKVEQPAVPVNHKQPAQAINQPKQGTTSLSPKPLSKGTGVSKASVTNRLNVVADPVAMKPTQKAASMATKVEHAQLSESKTNEPVKQPDIQSVDQVDSVEGQAGKVQPMLIKQEAVAADIQTDQGQLSPRTETTDQVLTGPSAIAQLAENQVQGEKSYPKTGERTNHLGLVGIAMIGLAGVVGMMWKGKRKS